MHYYKLYIYSQLYYIIHSTYISVYVCHVYCGRLHNLLLKWYLWHTLGKVYSWLKDFQRTKLVVLLYVWFKLTTLLEKLCLWCCLVSWWWLHFHMFINEATRTNRLIERHIVWPFWTSLCSFSTSVFTQNGALFDTRFCDEVYNQSLQPDMQAQCFQEWYLWKWNINHHE